VTRRAAAAALCGLLAAGCGGGGRTPTEPSGPASTLAVGGVVLSSGTRGPLAGVRVEIVGGAAAGRGATTAADGRYRIEGLAATSGFDVRASLVRYDPATAPAGGATLDFDLRRTPCGINTCAGGAADCNESLPLLVAPFSGDFRVSNQFDHWRPHAGFGTADDGRFARWCGSNGSYDGHNGWDWVMPVGTPILAAGSGRVARATTETPFFCPFLGRDVSGMYVQLEHASPHGETLVTEYLHLSAFRVATGDTVSAGQVIGLSGTTGCSTGPHLHFAVYRQVGNRGRGFFTVDPYGWQGAGADPWGADPDGAASTWLWQGTPPAVAAASTAIQERHHTLR
jgi:murein DD-endopeptidase MepM/ murein hydrolase activator NlpD